MEKKLTNSGPFRESTRKHSIYPRISSSFLKVSFSAASIFQRHFLFNLLRIKAYLLP
jgi:hypothetical protein